MNMDEEFESIYQKIYDASYSRLEGVKANNRKFLTIFTLVLVIINLILYIIPDIRPISIIFVCISVCILIFFYIHGRQIYTHAYKKCVIEGLVKAYNENLSFDPTIGISQSEYLMADFDRTFNEYTSEDRIYGRLNTGDSFQLAEVTTCQVTRRVDEQGREQVDRTETFRGMFGVVYLNKNSTMNVGVFGDSVMRRYSHNRVEVDSSEFEKLFDLVTDDKVSAMRIFTSDLIERYIDIRRGNRFGLEVKIHWDRVYFRFRCGEMFEPPVFVSGLKRDHLRAFYNQIYYPLELLDKTVEHVNEIN